MWKTSISAIRRLLERSLCRHLAGSRGLENGVQDGGPLLELGQSVVLHALPVK